MREEDFQKKIEYKFNDLSLLKTALTHSSFNRESESNEEDNERLEFLGDAFLDAIVGAKLYKIMTQYPEGKLTKTRSLVVCERALADIARELNLGDFMYLGHGEDIHGGREKDSILADCVEAVIGAIYIDGGYDKCEKFIERFFEKKIEDALNGKLFSDYKSQVQEILQSDGSKVDIKYIVDLEDGPSHDKTFKVHLECNGKAYGSGAGKSKKEAEQMAARNSILLLNK